MKPYKHRLKALIAAVLCINFVFAQAPTSYGERMNLPSPLNRVNSTREHVAACVAVTVAFELTAKGTNFDTTEARIWGGTVLRAKEKAEQYDPDPNFAPWVKKMV